MKYVITYQAYKKSDPNRQTELLFHRTDADNTIEAQCNFEQVLIADNYELVQVISVTTSEEE